ncbi:MAG: hypothetical protein AB7G28_06720 [Pirellulales bacterium]
MVSFLATAMMAIGVLASAPESTQWQSDYGDALAETRTQDNQPLLVVLDEPQAKETSVEPALLGEGDSKVVDKKLLKHYRLCHIDASTNYGQKVAGVFRAKRFPHVAIIDKSGKVVLFKKSGKITTTEWTNALEAHQDGERVAAKHVSYKLSDDEAASTPAYSNGSYCPSCQRNRW